MNIYNANYWNDKYKVPSNKKTHYSKKTISKQLEHRNSLIRETANTYAENMRKQPSELEKRMISFLNSHSVVYDFQRIFYIKKKNGWIRKYYIADFFIPSKNLIIETDGVFHQEQIKEDAIRTKRIEKHYPNIKIIRWKWHDFDSYIKMKNLLSLVV